MAGAALHKEINATRSRIILPGRKNSLFTVIFLSQIKLSMISLPCSAASHRWIDARTDGKILIEMEESS